MFRGSLARNPTSPPCCRGLRPNLRPRALEKAPPTRRSWTGPKTPPPGGATRCAWVSNEPPPIDVLRQGALLKRARVLLLRARAQARRERQRRHPAGSSSRKRKPRLNLSLTMLRDRRPCDVPQDTQERSKGRAGHARSFKTGPAPHPAASTLCRAAPWSAHKTG